MMPAESVHRHVDSAELDHDVGTSREIGDALLPFAEYFGAPAFVGADSERSAEMIEHDGCVRKSSRERSYHRQLRMVLPRLETEAEAVQLAKSFTKVLRLVQIRRRVGVRIPDILARVEAARVPDAAEARRCGGDMRLQHFLDCGAQRQIRKAHDSRR